VKDVALDVGAGAPAQGLTGHAGEPGADDAAVARQPAAIEGNAPVTEQDRRVLTGAAVT
jgi:hypothetical protein